jgi:hypothetical protein
MRLRHHQDPEGVPGSPTPAAIGIRRAATWGLVVLGALLVLDGSAANPWRSPTTDVAEDPIEAARPAVTAALGAHLRSRKASLSGEEQDRVVEAVLRSSRRHALDPYLVTAVLLVESDARPWAESGKGAIGLMQVMPHMAAQLDLAGNLATIESNSAASPPISGDVRSAASPISRRSNGRGRACATRALPEWSRSCVDARVSSCSRTGASGTPMPGSRRIPRAC